MDKENNNQTPTQEGGKTPESTSPGNSSTPSDGHKDGHTDTDKSKFIPRERFDEVNNRMKEAEAQLAQINADKAKQAEAEAIKKGEHEKVIQTKQTELDAYKAKEAEWETKTASMQKFVDAKFEAIKADHGEDVLNKIKTLIGSEDPWVILEKIDEFVALIGTNTRPSGGQPLGAGGGKADLEVLQEKINKGERLTPLEEKKYYEELAKLK